MIRIVCHIDSNLYDKWPGLTNKYQLRLVCAPHRINVCPNLGNLHFFNATISILLRKTDLCASQGITNETDDTNQRIKKRTNNAYLIIIYRFGSDFGETKLLPDLFDI